MNLYSRARKHIDMDRVKELREERIKREQIAEILQQQDKIRAELKEIEREESKYCDWKKELDEGMTTAGLGMINLDAVGDVDLVDLGNETPNQNVQPGATNNGGTYTFGPVTPGYGFASTLSFFPNTVDLTKVDTIVFDFTAGDITEFDFVVDIPGTSSVYSLSISSGRKVITLKQSDRIKNAFITWTLNKNQGDPVGTNRISGVALQRRRPMNVLVSLDDPEASAFIRDGDFDRLSNEEKKKKLEEQLRSSDEYLNKMFGEGMPKGATTIADYEPQKSFSDIKASLSPEDLKAISDRVGGSYSGSKGTEIAQGPSGFDRKPGTYHKNLIIPIDSPGSKWRPGEGIPLKDPLKNIPFTGPGLSKGTGDTQVASARGPYGTPGADKPYTRKGYKDKDGKFVDFDNPSTWPSIVPKLPRASKKQRTMVAHHEPQGEVIKEKKSFKDITKKIPGYYDGKPSPLGFPVEEPPKMKNGFHPDLVDGKKVANRFNRLDPQSAKAMPKTGNPHIDKKVRAAAKKPK